MVRSPTSNRVYPSPSAWGPPLRAVPVSDTTIYNRYNRWSQRGLWQRLFEQIAASGDVPRELSLDSSHVKAGRTIFGRHVAPTTSGLENVQNSTDDATIIDARLTRLAVRQMWINRGPCFVG